MSDRIPGSSCDNPIRYRGYRIFLDANSYKPSWADWSYVHENYDGPEDNRCGYGGSEAECRAEIDWKEDDK